MPYVNVDLGYGYLFYGYSSYGDEDLKHSKSTRLPYENEYTLSVNVLF